jgi:thimet oligopeptidase
MNLELIRTSYQPGELTRLCTEAIEKTTQQLDELTRTPSQKRDIHTTLLAFEKVTSDFSDAVTPLTFMSYVSKDEKISKESSECEEKVSQFGVSIYTRKDLYQLVLGQKSENTEQSRLYSETIEAFEDNGLKLTDDKLKQVKELKQKLAALESQFSTHLNQDSSFVDYSGSELTGVPEEFVKSLEKTPDGKYRVVVKEPQYVRIMENAKNPETRRKMLAVYDNRVAKENTKLLEEAIVIRDQIAKLMGYSTWADYRTHRRMAKDAKSVTKFLHGLKDKLSQRNKEDLKKLLTFKQESDPSAKQLNAWDLRYYSYQLRKRDYQLDDEQIREYFPAQIVIQGLFQVYSKLLGVKYIEESDAKVWAEGVKLFRIENGKNSELIGYFYTDFLPRKGKYGHAAAFTLVGGRRLSQGNYNHPVSAIVANFTPAEGERPVLLSHDEVETLFHEFGHIMHQTLTRAPYSSLSGSSVDQDFVEAPSQMLENWVYSPEVLRMLSGHYKDHQKKLPGLLIQQIIKAKDFNQGYFYTRQLLLGLFDVTCHTSHEPVDTSALYQRLHRELIGVNAIEGSHMPASFGHLMGGYDAGYYGYLWSKVYAEDMFTRFEKEGLTNPKVGTEYRKLILEQGKMVDVFEVLEKFLGRKPNSEAFYRSLHIH